jgi:hypothetical protein
MWRDSLLKYLLLLTVDRSIVYAPVYSSIRYLYNLCQTELTVQDRLNFTGTYIAMFFVDSVLNKSYKSYLLD